MGKVMYFSHAKYPKCYHFRMESVLEIERSFHLLFMLSLCEPACVCNVSQFGPATSPLLAGVQGLGPLGRHSAV